MAWLPPTVFPPRPPTPLARTARPGGYPSASPFGFLQGGAGAFLGDALADFGYGVSQGGFENGLGLAAQRTAQMQPYRAQEALAAREQKAAAEKAKANAKFILDPAISAAVASGQLDFKTGYDMWQQSLNGTTTALPDAVQTYQWYANEEIKNGRAPMPFAEWSGKGEETLKPTADMQEYEFAKSQGFPGTFEEYQIAMRQAGATKFDFNQNQGAAAAYADRMANADRILQDQAMIDAMTSVEQTAKSSVPWAGNFLTSSQRQQAEQAQRDFVNAILRRESGAVISDAEFENARKQYFPQPGDSKEVIAQKAANRRIALEGVKRAAGPNYQPPSLTPGGSTYTYNPVTGELE